MTHVDYFLFAGAVQRHAVPPTTALQMCRLGIFSLKANHNLLWVTCFKQCSYIKKIACLESRTIHSGETKRYFYGELRKSIKKHFWGGGGYVE